MFGGVKLVYVSPATLAMPKEIEEELAAQGIEQVIFVVHSHFTFHAY